MPIESEPPTTTTMMPVAENLIEPEPPVTTTLPPAPTKEETTDPLIAAAKAAFPTTSSPAPTEQNKPNEMKGDETKKSEAKTDGDTEEKKRGRPPLPRDSAGNIIREGATITPINPTVAAAPPNVVKTATTTVPEKFKAKKKKGEKPKNYYLQEALSNATEEDKKFIKENYTDVILKELPGLGAMLGFCSMAATHVYVYFKSQLDTGVYISAIGAAVPFAGAKFLAFRNAASVVEIESNDILAAKIRSAACPICQAHPNKPCVAAPVGQYHAGRWTEAGLKLPNEIEVEKK